MQPDSLRQSGTVLQIRLSPELLRSAKSKSKKIGMPLSEIIRNWLEYWVTK